MLFWKTKPWSVQLWWTKKYAQHFGINYKPMNLAQWIMIKSHLHKKQTTNSVIFRFFCFSLGGEIPGYIRAQPPLMSGRYGEYSTRCGLGEAFFSTRKAGAQGAEPRKKNFVYRSRKRRTLFTERVMWYDIIWHELKKGVLWYYNTRKRRGWRLFDFKLWSCCATFDQTKHDSSPPGPSVKTCNHSTKPSAPWKPREKP